MFDITLVKSALRFFRRRAAIATSKKPIFLNFPASTVCNQKCVMCNIHEKKKPDEIESESLHKILKDPLFENIESLGFSGGEPFMKRDLVEIFGVICTSLSNLKHFSINTNGRMPKRMAKCLPVLTEIAKENEVNLNIVFSIDGVGDLNNKVRGTSDAWEKLLESLDIARQNNIKPSALMTIHNMNWFDVFNVYDFCKNEDIAPYFGIATVIERLGNEDIHDQFEMQHLEKLYVSEFLEKLAECKNQKINKRIWYSNLLKQLAYGAPRTANCIAKDSGVYLSDSGKVSYCGVYDKELTRDIDQSYLDAFNSKNNREKIFNTMLGKHCGTCMHDYQSEPSLTAIAKLFTPSKVKKANEILSYSSLKMKKACASEKSALLFGWFGTETIGDKAIYGEIIHKLKDRGYQKITILTLRKYYTQRTIFELGYQLDDFSIHEISENKKPAISASIAIFCGGPIMGFADILGFYIFGKKLNRADIPYIIHGAGWGPFNNKFYEAAAKRFIRNSSGGFLREDAGCLTSKLGRGVDPAFHWVRRHRSNLIKSGRRLGISLRRLSNVTYTPGIEFDALVTEIAETVRSLLDSNTIDEVVLIPMNTHHVGGDDREVLRELKEHINRNQQIIELPLFYGPLEILREIEKCTVFLGTRFHSCVFSLACEIPTVGLEYTIGGGKISKLFENYNLQELKIELPMLTDSVLTGKITSALTNLNFIEAISIVNKNNEANYACDFY